MMQTKDVKEKISSFEQFVEEKLKKDLKDIETTLNIKNEKYKEWEELQTTLKTVVEFKEKDRDMLVKLDIGCGVSATCEITDYERTYVDVGLGCFLEMDCQEAAKYAEIRKRHLKREIDHLRELAVNVKVHIKLTLLAINELQCSLLPNYLERTNIK